MQFFPPELVFHVIEQGVGDADLHACSLVSRTWRAPAQERLLSRIGIYSDDSQRDPSSFISLLDSRPELRSYVRELHLLTRPRGANDSDSMLNRDVRAYDIRVILSKLPRVRSLSLVVHLVPGAPPSAIEHDALPRFEIDTLYMQYVIFRRTSGSVQIPPAFKEPFLDFLGMFSTIGTLKFRHAYVFGECSDQSESLVPVLPTELPHVRVLNWESATSRLMEHFVHCISMKDLQSLRIKVQYAGDSQDLQTCINAIAHLKELHVEFEYSESVVLSRNSWITANVKRFTQHTGIVLTLAIFNFSPCLCSLAQH